MTIETAKIDFDKASSALNEARNKLNEMKSKLHKANETNNAEIEARADAAVEGIERDEQRIINVPELTTNIAVQEKIVAALKPKLDDAKIALQDARSARSHGIRVKARNVMVERFGMSERNLIKFDRIESLDDLMDLLALARVWSNNKYDLASLFTKIIKTETQADREQAAERVKALL